MRTLRLAEEVGVTPRTVRRWLREAGVEPDWEPTAQEKTAWAIEAASEGVPRSWIAETIECSRDAVDKRMRKAHIPVEADWKNIQLVIRHHPALSRLHEEFAPK